MKSQLTLLNLSDLSQAHIDIPCGEALNICFKDNLILLCSSSVNQTPTLYMRHVEKNLEWVPVEKPYVLDDLDFRVISDIPTTDKKDHISAVMITSKLEKPIRDRLTVFAIHGGPCTGYTNGYISFYAFLAKLGINVVLTNYRGSTGVDEAYLNQLPGNCGTMDVEDCSEAIRYFIRSELVNPHKLALFGGSYGGFLVAHLCAKGEFQFTSAIMINPLLDFVSSLFTSDIPEYLTDLSLGLKYDPKWMPKLDDVAKMLSQSPLYRAGNSTVPTLMILGSKDLRVKMYQGLRWIEHLKSQGVETCCKVYPDTHQLLNHKTEMNISTAVWLVDHEKCISV